MGAVTDGGVVAGTLGAGATVATGAAALGAGGGALDPAEARGSGSPLACGGRPGPHAPRGPRAASTATVIALRVPVLARFMRAA